MGQVADGWADPPGLPGPTALLPATRPTCPTRPSCPANISPISRLLVRTFATAATLAAILLAGRTVLGPQRGLHAEYFLGDQPGGSPVISTIDQRITTDQVLTRWYGGPPSAFHVRWFGYLSVVSAGRHRFSLTSDDGAVLTVDGRPHRQRRRHEATTAAADVNLERDRTRASSTQEGGALASTGSGPAAPARSRPFRRGRSALRFGNGESLVGAPRIGREDLRAAVLLLAIAIAWRDRRPSRVIRGLRRSHFSSSWRR